MKIIVVFLFILSISIQLFFIFSSGYSIDSDQAITGLMAKHILEGKFPVFFYGHAFDASIEAVLASFYFFLFGISCHSLKLAPMTFGIIFCISIYYLVKELGDKELGLWALIFSLISPIYLFGHFIAPRTCYIETLAFGNLVFIFLLRAMRQPKFKNIFFLGIFAGISFWNSPLCIYYLVSGTIFIIIRGRKIINFKNIFSGILAFFIGSLPLWIYNFTHHFDSFRISYSSGGIDIINNLKTLLTYHGVVLLVSEVFNNTIFYWIIYGIFLISIGFFVVKNVYKYKSNYLLLIIFFFIIIAIYSRSQYATLNTQRHLLPLYTFIPIAVSYTAKYINRYKNIGIIFFIVILGINLSGSVLMHREWLPGTIRDAESFIELKEFLLNNKITTLYAPFWTGYKLNFVSNEEIVCSEYSEEGYEGYEELLEKTDNIAFLDDGSHRIEESLKKIRAKFSVDSVSGKGVFYNIIPPSIIGRAIPPANWRITGNYNLHKVRAAIDRDYDRFWTPVKTRKNVYPYVQIDLGEIYYIYKVVMFNKGCLVSSPGVNIYISKDGRQWDMRSQIDIVEPIFWSGPRPYYARWFGREEFWFGPVEARYIKVEYPTGENVEIDEIFVYQYKGMRKRDLNSYNKCINEIVDFLKSKDLDFVYADFWPSVKIREISNGDIETLRPINKAYPYREYTSRGLKLDSKIAFLINNEDIDEFVNVLNESGIKLERKVFGYYSLYYSTTPITPAEKKEFIWWGLGLLKTNIIDYDISKWKYPPKEKTDARFENGTEFLGYNLYYSKKLIPKKYIKIDYFWKVFKEPPKNLFVFVHFIKDKKIVFQNDHPFLEQYLIRQISSSGRIFKETYLIKVPNGADIGEYNISLGLWLPEKSKRIIIKDPVKKKKSSIKIGELYVYPCL